MEAGGLERGGRRLLRGPDRRGLVDHGRPAGEAPCGIQAEEDAVAAPIRHILRHAGQGQRGRRAVRAAQQREMVADFEVEAVGQVARHHGAQRRPNGRAEVGACRLAHRHGAHQRVGRGVDTLRRRGQKIDLARARRLEHGLAALRAERVAADGAAGAQALERGQLPVRERPAVGRRQRRVAARAPGAGCRPPRRRWRRPAVAWRPATSRRRPRRAARARCAGPRGAARAGHSADRRTSSCGVRRVGQPSVHDVQPLIGARRHGRVMRGDNQGHA